MSQITPLEIDILFTLCDLLHQTGKVMYSDFQEIAPEQYMKQVTRRLTEIKAVEKPEDRGALMAVLESVYRFTLGSIAGATGATAVYAHLKPAFADENGYNSPLSLLVA